jgi:hypothetical protein
MSKHRNLQKRFALTAPTTRRADEGEPRGNGAQGDGRGRPQPSRGNRGDHPQETKEASVDWKASQGNYLDAQYSDVADPSGGSELIPPYQMEDCIIHPSPSLPSAYPRPGQTIGEYRNEKRQSIVDWAQPGCDLPVNPDAGPQAFQKTRPLSKRAKMEALGLREEPDTLFEINRGDAFNGKTQFRRAQYFSIIAQASGVVIADPPPQQTAGQVTTRRQFKPIALATQTSSDQRPRYWLISAYGTRVIRTTTQFEGSALEDYQLSPLSEQDILNSNLLPEAATTQNNFGGFPPTPQPDSNPQIQSVSYNRFRIQYQDESGGRVQDIDVIGTRSVVVYAFTVTVFAMVPEDRDAYEVTKPSNAVSSDPAVIARINPPLPREPQPIADDTVNQFVFEDTILAARVVPTSLENYKPIKNHVTLSAEAVSGFGDGGIGDYTVVPIPPGSLTLKVYSKNIDNADINGFRFYFDVGRGFGAQFDSLVTCTNRFVPFDPVTFESFEIRVPNATDILIAPTSGQVQGFTFPFIFVFETNA